MWKTSYNLSFITFVLRDKEVDKIGRGCVAIRLDKIVEMIGIDNKTTEITVETSEGVHTHIIGDNLVSIIKRINNLDKN